MLKDFLWCFSLANLIFLKEWHRLLATYDPKLAYFRKGPPDTTLLLATIAAILLLSCGFWLCAMQLRKSGSRFLINLSHAVFLLTLVVALNLLVLECAQSFQNHTTRVYLGILATLLRVLLISAAVLVFAHPTKITVRAGRALLMVLSPLFFLNLASIGWMRCQTPTSAFVEREASHSQISQAGSRVVVLIFDELDQNLTFDNRPGTIELPEIDRFRSQALYATRAYPPGGNTNEALPALTTGRIVSSAEVVAPSSLLLTFKAAHQKELWGAQPNVFSRASDAGFASGLVGWYHPYCRILGGSLADCSWEEPVEPFVEQEQLRFIGLGPGILNLLTDKLDLVTFSGYFGILPSIAPASNEVIAAVKTKHLQSYDAVLKRARGMVSNPRLNLAWIHFPFPHPPGIYDRREKKPSLSPTSNYLDNLELVDRTLHDLRSRMELADLGDKTTVVVTSDHPLRTNLWKGLSYWSREFTEIADAIPDKRVPFLVLIPGQTAGSVYSKTINSVLLHDLVLALLKKEISTVGGLATWLDDNRTRFAQDGNVSS